MNKYILVDAKDITRPIYKTKREFAYNDFENVFEIIGEESLDYYFRKINLPIEFQKVAYEIKPKIFKKNECTDIVTGKRFDLSKKEFLYKATNTRRTISEQVSFESNEELISEDIIQALYMKIKNINMLHDYVNVLSNFYRIENKTQNMHKYDETMSKYNMDDKNEQNLIINEIISLDNKGQLIYQMNLYELYYLLNHSSDLVKKMFNDIINNKIDSRKVRKRIKHY